MGRSQGRVKENCGSKAGARFFVSIGVKHTPPKRHGFWLSPRPTDDGYTETSGRFGDLGFQTDLSDATRDGSPIRLPQNPSGVR